jgi:alkylation response protein AidB-like acyl-CoA dehydrogenase
MTVAAGSILSDALLQGCRQRAAGYDRENKFCQEDFDELKAAGYLKMAIPKEFGGLDYSLHQAHQETRRLARHAPATALCMNMHHYWVGTAADTWRMTKDKSIEFILEEAAKGEVFAAGHAEPGNETSLTMSATKAEKVPGGYKFTGRKAFGSLTPVWTRLGLHGMDTSDPKNPKIVHGFLPRDSSGFTIKETWDVMGMRATRSDDTLLEGAFIPDKYIARVVPAGLAGADLFILSIFAWALGGFSNVYYGLSERLVELTVEHVKNKTSIGLTRTMAHHPEVQRGVA